MEVSDQPQHPAIYPLVKESQVPFEYGLGGLQSQSGYFGQEIILLLLPGVKSCIIQCVA